MPPKASSVKRKPRVASVRSPPSPRRAKRAPVSKPAKKKPPTSPGRPGEARKRVASRPPTKASYKAFLALNTEVDTDFLRDIGSLLINPRGRTHSEPVVELDEVKRWIGSERFILLRNLRRSYEEGVDYVIRDPPKVYKMGGHMKKIVLVTLRCFKNMAMKSDAPEAQRIRDYFHLIEAYLIKNHKEISSGMDVDIKKTIDAINKNPERDGPGWVYVIFASFKDAMLKKVGRAEDWTHRERGYNVGRVEGVKVAYRMKVAKRMFVERCLKRSLAENRWNPLREIYRVTTSEAKKLLSACDGISGSARGDLLKGGAFEADEADEDGAHFMAFSSKLNEKEVLSRFAMPHAMNSPIY